MRKPRSKIEVLNDIDDRLFALYRCVRDPSLHLMLAYALDATLFARKEFELSCLPVDRSTYNIENDYLVEVARRLIVRGSMAFGTGKEESDRAGFRDYTGPARSAPVRDWDGVDAMITALHERLKGIIVDSRDAVEVIKRHDSPHTLHYVDPPYVGSTRAERERSHYKHELDEPDHQRLLDVLMAVKGMVVLSGYTSMFYTEILQDWRWVARDFQTTGGTRTEVIWLNPAADTALASAKKQLSLFDAGLLQASA